MSIKLNYGLKLKSNQFLDINSELDLISENLNTIALDKAYFLYFKTLLTICDFYSLNKNNLSYNQFNELFHNLFDVHNDNLKFIFPKNNKILFNYINYLMEHSLFIKNNEIKEKFSDFSLSLKIYPIEEYVLIYPISSNMDLYYSALLKHHNISEYCYFNNYDKPEQYSKKEWKKREEDWNKLYSGKYPDNNGFYKTVISHDFLFFEFMSFKDLEKQKLISLLKKFNLSKEERIQFFTENALFKNFCIRNNLKGNSKSYSEFSTYKESDNYLKELEEKNKEYSSLIPDDIHIKEYLFDTIFEFKE